MGQRSLRVGLVQMHCESNREANWQIAESAIADAVRRGATLVCLPELFTSRYFCQSEDASRYDLAEPVPGPTTERFEKIAKKHKVGLIVPVFERRGPGMYHNSAAIVDRSGASVGFYRKMHIPDDPAYYEKYYFTPGDLGFRAFNVDGVRLGVLICWDQWYPEGARLTALRGAEILFYPTAIGWHPHEKAQYGVEQHSAWETVQRGHAVANGAFVIAVNRVGVEENLEFWGRSFVADPMGTVLFRADEQEQTAVVEIDLGRVEYVRRNWPFFRDRRIDAYGDVTKRWIDS